MNLVWWMAVGLLAFAGAAIVAARIAIALGVA